MGRVKGSGSMGPTRSTRLPAALDEWLESRLMLHRDKSVSEILLELIHGGLRLREGYMAIHRRVLEARLAERSRGVRCIPRLPARHVRARISRSPRPLARSGRRRSSTTV